METQHTACRQFRSVFRIASFLNTNFGSLMPEKCNICSHWLESIWKHNAQYIAELRQYLRLHQCQILMQFGIASIVGSDSSELRLKLRSKLTGFEIKVELTGNETKRLVFQL